MKKEMRVNSVENALRGVPEEISVGNALRGVPEAPLNVFLIT
jgi:hypothetical protein